MLLEQLPRIDHRRDRGDLQISLITFAFRSRQHHVEISDIGISQLVDPRSEHVTDYTALKRTHLRPSFPKLTDSVMAGQGGMRHH